MTPSKRVKQWSLGLIIVFALVAVAFVWLRSSPPKLSVFVLDSSLESSVGVESSALDSRANPALEPSYFTIPNPTPSAHASTIVALEHTALPQSLRDSHAFMALFFAGSREGARDVGIYQSFFVRDSALGNHSGDFVDFRATADHQSSSAPKSTKSTTSTTTIPRIYEEDKGAGREKSCHKQTELESSMKVDSMDCHALPSDKARNDDKKVDSRNFTQNAENVFCSQAARRQDLGDKNGALQGESRAHTLAYVTADSPQQSPFLAPKPTPKPIKAQSSSDKPTPRYMEYYMFNEPAWNTFDPQVAQNSLGKLQRIVKVPLLPLGEVLHTYVPKGVEIDFLSIDCEGFDLAVLESNDWDSFVPHIIIVEILTNIYGELDMVALQDNEIARFLFSKGYALVAKAHNSVIFQHKDKR